MRIQDSPYEGADPQGGVATYDFAKFCKKLHKIERTLGRRGVGAPGHPLDPPMLTEANNNRRLLKSEIKLLRTIMII